MNVPGLKEHMHREDRWCHSQVHGNLCDAHEVVPFDSSDGRAEDCRLVKRDILRSLVQFLLEGEFLVIFVLKPYLTIFFTVSQ